jgi:hypothetical protein
MPEAITFQCPLSTVVMAGDGDAVGLRSELLRANDLRFDATRKMSGATLHTVESDYLLRSQSGKQHDERSSTENESRDRADRLTSAAPPPGHRPARDHKGRLCLG